MPEAYHALIAVPYQVRRDRRSDAARGRGRRSHRDLEARLAAYPARAIVELDRGAPPGGRDAGLHQASAGLRREEFAAPRTSGADRVTESAYPPCMKRRDALKTIGGLAGAAGLAKVLPACSSADDPYGFASGPQEIKTYVYMMMENRSYDHWFGARKLLEGLPGDGLTAGMSLRDLDGKAVPIYVPDRDSVCALDPPHGWDTLRGSFNAGKNDGFLTQHQLQHGKAAIEPMQYLTRTQLPVSYALADAYTSCDRWFCSMMGPTWPNRFYWHAGTCFGVQSNVLIDPDQFQPSIYHRLDAKGIDWAYYYATIPVVGIIGGIPNLDAKLRRFRQFLEDAAAGTLPAVVYIDPAFNDNDDHPPVHPINGQALIASVYKALATSPQWQNCVLVITYDENGGFYDHVPPPKVVDERAALGFDQLGFRVPTMVIGPYVKQGYVSSVTYDHTSALKQLQNAFKLDPLTARTTAAADLTDCLDLERMAQGKWAKPVQLPAVNPDDWPMPEVCTTGSLREDHVVHVAADAHPERIAGFDLRGELPEYRRAIWDFLAKQ
jgi:phospholipase C